ncbi:activator-dependent family glycosyltransferase [Kitasatospora sp. SUK 42]|uniref:activator-dependent family glycosyltransferase n=1 Tax=Kitasatospora sp. SUK 42 TaxID=1588882 RepID=UPI0018CBDF02|nr:activator-dependent family glycosyltransferase [Kitasatospora sp. SUK 42]MBV2156621.1 activator-dependent family glycosyltransferase [Kitasatospora sp. SUK 42]
MRVLFLTCLNKSHLYAMTPLAWALQIAGHSVRVASQPDLAEDVMRTGFTAVPVGDPLNLESKLGPAQPAAPRPGPGPVVKPVQSTFPEEPHAHLSTITDGFFPMICPDRMFDDLVDYAVGWKPDLVVWNTLAFAGPVAALASGAAHARLLFGADGLAQIRAAFHRERAGHTGAALNDPLEDWLGPKLERIGHRFTEEVVLGQWTMDPMPSWVPHPPGDVHYVPMRHVPYNGPSVTPEWLSKPPARRRVCVTLGTSHRESHGIEVSVPDLLEGVADLDVEVVATLNRRQLDQVDSVPDNVRIADFVPLNVLLPTCSAIVHHGGTATFAAALEHGVPQLIAPSTYWTERWWGPVAEANGLEARGAGLYVGDSDTLTAEALRDGLVRVLDDPAFAARAAAVRTERLATPTPNDLVHTLERLTAQRRGTC